MNDNNDLYEPALELLYTAMDSTMKLTEEYKTRQRKTAADMLEVAMRAGWTLDNIRDKPHEFSKFRNETEVYSRLQDRFNEYGDSINGLIHKTQSLNAAVSKLEGA